MKVSKSILVTGGAGFIGSHVVERLLARGDVVTVVDNFNDYYSPELKRRNAALWGGRVRLAEVDICDGRGLRGVFEGGGFEAIIHLAARAGIRASLEAPDLFSQVNIMGTQNVLELAREFGVGKFIFGSSSSVYGMSGHAPFREEDVTNRPLSPYAATKLAGEALGHVYHYVHGLEVVCLRFFTVYGARQRPDLAIHRFARRMLAGRPIELYGDGTTRRDFTHVGDIVDGICGCLEGAFGFEVINLGQGRTVTLLEVVRLLEVVTGRRAEIRWLPAQPADMLLTHADISKAQGLLNYHPDTPLERGLAGFVEWLRGTEGISE